MTGDRVNAAVLTGPRRIELQDFPVPDVGHDDGLLRVEASGVCGADWDPLFLGHAPQDRIGQSILGHEIVGRVWRIGPTAAARWGVQEGDRIAVEEDIPCGRCRLCRTGRYRMCNGLSGYGEGRRYGFTSVAEPPYLWGGYSEVLYLHPNSVVHKVPDDIPAAEATLFLPISNGIEWVRRYGQLQIGGTVVVQGPGQHGLGCVVAAREGGAGLIVVTGRSTDGPRLEIAKALGADVVINVDEEHAVRRLRKLTDGVLADVVVDTTHRAPQALSQAIDMACIGGTVVVAGLKLAAVELPTDKLIMKDLSLRGANGHGLESVSAAISIIASKKYPIHEMCSHTFALDQTEDALRTVGGEGAAMPVHVTVRPE